MDRRERLLDRLVPRANAPAGYALAVALVAVGVLVRILLAPPEAGFPFITSFPVVLLACFIGGPGPAVLATALSALAVGYFFLPPFGKADLHAVDVWGVAAFAASALLACVPIELLRRERDRNRKLLLQREALLDEKEMLLRELNHRIQNTFALVQALAAQTFRHGTDLAEVECAFLARLNALARVSALLAADAGDGYDLRALAEAVLEPYRRDGSPRLDGPEVALPARAARVVGLALHELATNAAKHGALSVPEGAVDLTWRAEEDGPGRRLLLVTWTERDGPEVRPPERRGLGRTLIERGLVHEVGGAARLEFPPEGVRCRLEVPLAASAPAGAWAGPAPEP